MGSDDEAGLIESADGGLLCREFGKLAIDRIVLVDGTHPASEQDGVFAVLLKKTVRVAGDVHPVAEQHHRRHTRIGLSEQIGLSGHGRLVPFLDQLQRLFNQLVGNGFFDHLRLLASGFLGDNQARRFFRQLATAQRVLAVAPLTGFVTKYIIGFRWRGAHHRDLEGRR